MVERLESWYGTLIKEWLSSDAVEICFYFCEKKDKRVSCETR